MGKYTPAAAGHEKAKVAACVALLDRGWGKPEQSHEMNADIQITIRQILDNPKPGDSARVIESATGNATRAKNPSKIIRSQLLIVYDALISRATEC